VSLPAQCGVLPEIAGALDASATLPAVQASPQAAAIAGLLAEIALFQPLWPEERVRLAAQMRPKRFAKGEVVFHKDDPATHLYVIAAGSVKISIQEETGREVLVAVYRGGDVFGDLALFDEGPRSATVTALTETLVYSLAGDDLFAVLERNPKAMRQLLARLTRIVRRLSGQVGDFVFLDLESRVAKYLLDLSELSPHQREVELTQEDLAAFVGGTRAAVNRALADLEKAGAITVARKHIEVTDRDKLRSQIQY
jgi:CRP/FNR family transcriptional regulator, cyclic AMP receptor protein